MTQEQQNTPNEGENITSGASVPAEGTTPIYNALEAQNEARPKISPDIRTELTDHADRPAPDIADALEAVAHEPSAGVLAELGEVTMQELADAEPPAVLVEWAGMPIAYAHGLTTITADSGVGKSSFISMCLSEYEDKRVAWVDTEQPKPDMRRIMETLAHLRGLDDVTQLTNVRTFELSKFETPTQRREVLGQICQNVPCDIVVLDNLRDLLVDSTSRDEALDVLSWLHRAFVRRGVVVIVIVHWNKSGKIDGHLGSMAHQKSSVVIQLEKKDTGAGFRVRYSKHRHGPASESRSVSFDSYGVPHVDDQPCGEATTSRKPWTWWATLAEACGGNITSQAMRLHVSEVSEVTRERMRKQALQDGFLIRHGNGSATRYTLATPATPID